MSPSWRPNVLTRVLWRFVYVHAQRTPECKVRRLEFPFCWEAPHHPLTVTGASRRQAPRHQQSVRWRELVTEWQEGALRSINACRVGMCTTNTTKMWIRSDSVQRANATR